MKALTLDEIRLEDCVGHIQGKHIDEKIEGLVKAINYFGIRTIWSCQGSFEKYHFPFPWVQVWLYPNIDSYQAALSELLNQNPKYDFLRKRRDSKLNYLRKSLGLVQTIREYNSNNGIMWKFECDDAIYLQPEFPAKNEEELDRLQDDAQKVADFIFLKANHE